MDGSVLPDLGRLNRIVDFSEELAYATVQPGVTQGPAPKEIPRFCHVEKMSVFGRLDENVLGPQK